MAIKLLVVVAIFKLVLSDPHPDPDPNIDSNVRQEVDVDGARNRTKLHKHTKNAPSVCAGETVTFGSQKLTFSVDDEHCYQDWFSAVAACAENGRRLATLEHPAEVHTYINSIFSGHWFWTGGSDAANEGQWVWLDGQPFAENFPWHSGEPNGRTKENYLTGWGGIGFNDAPSTWVQRYICEDVPTTTKAPTSSLTSTTTKEDPNLKEVIPILEGLVTKIEEVEHTLEGLVTKIEGLVTKIEECPEGLISPGPGNQCFLLIKDSTRTWDAAKEACNKKGLQLAHPYYPIMVRRAITEEYGLTDLIWLNARGDGSVFKWQGTGETLSSSNLLWWPNEPGSDFSTTSCLGFLTRDGWMNNAPYQPYYRIACSKSRYALCELVR